MKHGKTYYLSRVVIPFRLKRFRGFVALQVMLVNIFFFFLDFIRMVQHNGG